MTNTSDKDRSFIRLGDDSFLHDQWLVSYGPSQNPDTGQGWVHVESSTSDNTVTIDDKKLTIDEARNLARALTEAADHAQTRPEGTYRKTSNATTSIRHSTHSNGTSVTVRHHSTNDSSDVVVTQNGRVSVVQSGNVITGGSLIGYSPE